MRNTVLKEEQSAVAIILLNYCNYKDTYACIKSLKAIDYSNYKVFIVDNASPNESIIQLEKLEDEQITILKSRRNGGFAYGNNIGIMKAIGNCFEYVLLLNNDTMVTPNFLSKMIIASKSRNDIGITTCKILYGREREKVWYAGGDVDWKNIRAIHRGINQNIDKVSANDLQEVGFASGCCMLISIDVIKNVGVLPEDYFMYYEDLDYCVHMRDNGRIIMYEPNAVIYHYVSSSSGGDNSPFVIEWNNRSRRKFYNKYKDHFSIISRFYIVLKCECREIVKILLSKHRYRGLKAYMKSFIYTE